MNWILLIMMREVEFCLNIVFQIVYFHFREKYWSSWIIIKRRKKEFFIWISIRWRKNVYKLLILSNSFYLFFLKTDIGDTEVCVLSSALKVNSSLTLLNLAFIKYSITLSPFMSALHSINNNIGDTGICSLSSALEVNSTLTSLDLRMCFVWIVFSVLFCYFICLLFWFVMNNIGESGISSLSESLKVNSSLTQLNLGVGLLLLLLLLF